MISESKLVNVRDVETGVTHEIPAAEDRTYFHSIYYREPGGILFEIATNPPGFAFDESSASMGSDLMLPRQCESMRAQIEKFLPPLQATSAST